MEQAFHNNFTEDEYTRVIGRALARDEGGNKGTFGRLLVIAGSCGMAGAAYLCGMAAFGTGCGSVRFYTPEYNRIILQILLPEAITDTYMEDTPTNDGHLHEDEIHDLVSWADAVVMGPGIGQTKTALAIVQQVLSETAIPMVLDADALNLIAVHPDMLIPGRENCILTPHPGELARLLSMTVPEVVSDREYALRSCVDRFGVTTLLKGQHSLIGSPDGMVWKNETGNSGMAVAGSGDVLAGIAGGFLARGLGATLALRLAVYAHGMAGDIAARTIGKNAMTARDILIQISEAVPK